MPSSSLRMTLVSLVLCFRTTFAWVAGSASQGRSNACSGRALFSAVGSTRSCISNENGDSEKLDLKLLLIDHYDSFTYNLADLLAQLCVETPTIVAADCFDSWGEFLYQQQQQSRTFDGVVLSPGPGHPKDAMSSLSRDCVRQNRDLPVLGVCLGHQILGHVYGATVDLAPEPVHGQVKGIRLLGPSSEDLLWKGISVENGNIQATRYHSLQVSQLEGTGLIPTAVTNDDRAVLMSMRHEDFLHFGVQFHPESIGTNETGKQLLRNFVQLCWDHKQKSSRVAKSATVSVPAVQTMASSVNDKRREPSFTSPESAAPFSVYIHKVLDLPPNGANMQPIDVMNEILAGEDYSFWLDEARANGQTQGVSILGASRRRVEYWGREKPTEQQGIFVWNEDSVFKHDRCKDILTYLQREHGRSTDHSTMVCFEESGAASSTLWAEEILHDTLPFDYRGGHVGYLGYEVRHDTARYLDEKESGRRHDHESVFEKERTASNPNVPTAAFLWAERSFVYDHQTCAWYLVGVAPSGDDGRQKCSILDWMRTMSIRLQIGRMKTTGGKAMRNGIRNTSRSTPTFTPNRSRETYNCNFAECIEHIRQGESYELCLTNQLETRVLHACAASPFDLYSILRRRNPAPFSAFFNWNADQRCQQSVTQSAVAICCSSPERFVSVKRKRQPNLQGTEESPLTLEVEAKPIKGTIARVLPSDGRNALTEKESAQDAARAYKLQSSVKDRAENLMIVDLLRNDLSRVCETGSVHVAKLMDIESFATVHQMVSTIRGALDPSQHGAVDVLKACFPGGSMTGAPKFRTMELLHQIEEGVSRGPYSGCLGYISLNGCMDMNIVIRTAVLTPDSNNAWKVSIGAGGAITALSESTDEYNEMMLKASAIIEAVQEWASTATSPGSAMDDSDYYSETHNGDHVAIPILNVTETLVR